MSRRTIAGLFEVIGLLVIAAGFGLLAPWLGLLALGIGALAVGVALELGQASRPTAPRPEPWAVMPQDRTPPRLGGTEAEQKALASRGIFPGRALLGRRPSGKSK